MDKNKDIEKSQVQRAEGTWPFGPIVLSTRTTVAPELTENAPAPTSACSQALLAYFENKNAQIGEEACKQFRTVLFVMQHCTRLAMLLFESASAPALCHTSTSCDSLHCSTQKPPCLTSSMRSHAQSSRTNSQQADAPTSSSTWALTLPASLPVTVHPLRLALLLLESDSAPPSCIPFCMPSNAQSHPPGPHAPMPFIIMYPHGSLVSHEGAESQFQISMPSFQCATNKLLLNMLMFHVGHMKQPLCQSALQHWSLQMSNGEC